MVPFKIIIVSLLISSSSIVWSMENTLTRYTPDLPEEIWINVLVQGFYAQKNARGLKEFGAHFELICKQLFTLKRNFLDHYTPSVHLPLLTRLYENTQDISKGEIALALGLDNYRNVTQPCTQGYIYLGKTLMNTIADKEKYEEEKLALVQDLIEKQGADVNYSRWTIGLRTGKIYGEETPLWKARYSRTIFAYLLEHGAHPEQTHNGKGETVVTKLQSFNPLQQHYWGNPLGRVGRVRLAQLYQDYLQNPNDPQLLVFFKHHNLVIKESPLFRQNLGVAPHLCPVNIITNLELLFQRGVGLLSKPNGCGCDCILPLYLQYRHNPAQVSPIARYQPKPTLWPKGMNIFNILHAPDDDIEEVVSRQDYKRRTLLHLIFYKYFPKKGPRIFNTAKYDNLYTAIELLLKKGADVNAQDGMGRTSLHLALTTSMGYIPAYQSDYRVLGTKIIKLLIDKGANPYIKDYSDHFKGETCIDLARSYTFKKDLLTIMKIPKPFPPIINHRLDYWITDNEAIQLLNNQNN